MVCNGIGRKVEAVRNEEEWQQHVCNNIKKEEKKKNGEKGQRWKRGRKPLTPPRQ